jgi:hypothetical protein
MPFDYAQESIRQAHHERNQQLAVRPEILWFLSSCIFKAANFLSIESGISLLPKREGDA